MSKPNTKIILTTLYYIELIELGRTITNCRASTSEPSVGINTNITIPSEFQ